MSSSLKMQQQQNLGLKTDLRMTVQMRQSIEMLLKNQFELREMILEEVSENPFLEIESWGDEQEEPPQEQSGEKDRNVLDADVTVPLMINDNSDNMSNILADFDWEQIRETSSNNFGDTNLSKSNDLPDNLSFENTIPDEESFSQSLDFQISVSDYPDNIKDVMIYMAYNLSLIHI